MTILDSKLKEICETFPYPDQAVETIKQAFIDDGWIRPADYIPENAELRSMHYEFVENNNDRIIPIMTGQEWYDRFEKEISAFTAKHDQPMKQEALDAAKLAAGIKEEA